MTITTEYGSGTYGDETAGKVGRAEAEGRATQPAPVWVHGHKVGVHDDEGKHQLDAELLPWCLRGNQHLGQRSRHALLIPREQVTSRQRHSEGRGRRQAQYSIILVLFMIDKTIRWIQIKRTDLSGWCSAESTSGFLSPKNRLCPDYVTLKAEEGVR